MFGKPVGYRVTVMFLVFFIFIFIFFHVRESVSSFLFFDVHIMWQKPHCHNCSRFRPQWKTLVSGQSLLKTGLVDTGAAGIRLTDLFTTTAFCLPDALFSKWCLFFVDSGSHPPLFTLCQSHFRGRKSRSEGQWAAPPHTPSRHRGWHIVHKHTNAPPVTVLDDIWSMTNGFIKTHTADIYTFNSQPPLC